jgi:hypothetical protein
MACLGPALSGQAQSNQIECGSKTNAVKAATNSGRGTNAVYNFPADGSGHLDPVPLLTTTVKVGGGRPSCLIAHFSAMAQPLDNQIVFQVRLDGVPMEGHMSNFVGILGPVVTDPEETDLNQLRMVSYNFFKEVHPGEHTVEVFFAACCSGAPPPVGTFANALNPVLTLEFTAAGGDA